MKTTRLEKNEDFRSTEAIIQWNSTVTDLFVSLQKSHQGIICKQVFFEILH